MASTMRRLAPKLGTTPPGLRTALIDAGLLDPAERRPTRMAHASGCASYYERAKNGGYMRFPIWNGERLLELIPEIRPSRLDVLRSFGSRHGAGRAIRTSATLLREIEPALATALGMMASDQTLTTIEAMSKAAERMAWGQANLVPALARLHALIGTRVLEGEAADALAAIEGAVQWVSTSVRTRPPAIRPVILPEETPPSRDERHYGDSHSIAIGTAERRLLETGYALNHLRPRGEDVELVGAILVPLSRRVAPDATSEWHSSAAGQPLRVTRHRSRLAIGTLVKLPSGEALASAHAAAIAAGRLTIQTEVAGYVMVDAAGGILDAAGDETIRLWLADMADEQAGRATRERAARDLAE